MGTKVQNTVLNLRVPEYDGSANNLIKVADENTLEYVTNDVLKSCINHTDVISGLELKSYLNNLIISNGYFYENDKLYMFENSTHLEIAQVEESNISLYDINGEVDGIVYNNNGLVSGFEGVNYIVIPTEFKPASNNWEWKLKFSVTANNVSQQIIGGVNRQEEGFELGLTDAGKFRIWLGTALNKYDIASAITGTHVVVINKNYWVKVTFNGSRYVVSYSLNDIDYIEDIIVENSTPICDSFKSLGGDYYGKTSGWRGSIDLNETYFKINDEIIWKGVKPINEYTVYYLYDTNTFVYSDVEPEVSHKVIGKFRISGNNITYKNPSMDLATSYEHGFIIDKRIDTIGYRVYSDGWKEQWGNNANPVFPIAFNEVPFMFTNGATKVSKTNMTISEGYWYACGF